DVNAPRAFPELACLGRWALCFDGLRGILDLYHVPDTQKWFGDGGKDYRLGTFYENGDPAKAFRVNGSLDGKQITFRIDPKKPNLPRGELSGREFRCYFGKDGFTFLAGTCAEGDEKPKGGYAQRLFSPGRFQLRPPPFEAEKLSEVAALLQ